MKTKFNGILTLLLALVVQISFAQQKTVSGTVSDESGELPGVSVIIKGTTKGAETDFDGKYTIKANSGDVLVFRYLGYKTVEKTVGTSNTVNVKLAEGGQQLEEVVVIGYTNKKRGDLSSAISSVTSAQLEKQTNSVSIDNALQGVATGVQVTAQNGKPGNAAFVRIRGIGSINAGSEPLYLLDGIQVDEDQIIGINPSDIERMDVLKDAASTAIYGARGANGVVVITTKGGKKNKKAQIRLQTRLGLATEAKRNFQMMNARQKLEYERAVGVGPGSTQLLQSEWDRLISQDHDWTDDLLKDAEISSVNLSVQGGDEKLTYFMSISNDSNTGIIELIESAFTRTSTRLNVGYDANDWLKLSTNLSFSTSNDQDPRDRNNVQNPINGRFTANPYEPVYLTDANGDRIPNRRGLDTFNPTHSGLNSLAQVRANQDDDTDNRFFGTFKADIKLSDAFSYQFGSNVSYFNRTARGVLHAGSALDLIFNGEPTGSADASNSNTFQYSILNKLNFNKTFNEKHSVNATVFMEYLDWYNENSFARSQGFVINGPTTISAGATPLTTTGGNSRRTLFSVASSVDYIYDDKYIVNATVRRDGSSRFGANNKYGTFWGASAAWNISKENFFTESAVGKTVDNLKLRINAGTSGNDQIGTFPSITTYGFDAYNGGTAAAPSNFGDPNLGWEQSFTYGAGIEFGLFNSRITGVVDYYKKNTKDLLLQVPISLFQGGGSIFKNIGEIENSGWEFELRGDIIRGENFRWNAGVTFSTYDSEVLKLATDEDLTVNYANYTTLRVGEEVHSFFLSRYKGVNPANGQALFLDANDNVTTSDADNVLLSGKTPFAQFDGGFNTSISYKGLDVTADFYFKGGNYIMNLVESQHLSDGTSANDNQRVDAFNYWKQPGDVNVLPNPVTNGYLGSTNANNRNVSSSTNSTRYLQRGDYLRLRNLQIGYSLPSQYLEKVPFTQIRMYMAGTNLWTYIPYYKGDPEVGIGSAESNPGSSTRNQIPGEYSLNSYPTLRTISFGLDLKF
ncbi:SusC/RagA family TonB-linked outer membrane protein [uncultured Polaribacter sp.]|uniref:SusC/RagA family TonB-linked outer membrane protein n=1 Tax=uncultured Polaribacter sp. TaxID=174711 RepID=UPI0026276459|nr:SusC/RagA family TonB-linked outer membrane protein [uncultured Polaribacter sp.]